jgi:hypothetical protein
MAIRTRRRREVLLPWERSRLRYTELLSSQRWKALLAAVLALGALWAMWRVAQHRERVRVTETAIAEVHRAIAAFRADVGRCPRSTIELVHPPRSGSRYLSKIPDDGWGNTLFIRCPSREDSSRADVVSAGPSASFLIDDNIY